MKQEAAEVDTGKAGSKSTNKKPVFLYRWGAGWQ